MSCDLIFASTGAARFMFKGVEVPEHSLVVRDEVGVSTVPDDVTLRCESDYSGCCTDTENGWFFDYDVNPPATGPRPVNTGSGNWHQTRDGGVVRLHHTGSGTSEGIFLCVIRVSATELQTLYVGVYPSVDDGGADASGDGKSV